MNNFSTGRNEEVGNFHVSLPRCQLQRGPFVLRFMLCTRPTFEQHADQVGPAAGGTLHQRVGATAVLEPIRMCARLHCRLHLHSGIGRDSTHPSVVCDPFYFFADIEYLPLILLLCTIQYQSSRAFVASPQAPAERNMNKFKGAQEECGGA